MVDAGTKNMLLRLGVIVKTLRNQRGFSQEELAYRCGLHRTYVSDVERGARNISMDSITRLARALEMPLANIFAKTESLGLDPSEQDRFSGKPVEILLVEDNAQHAELTLRALEKNGVTNFVSTVQSGEDALSFIFAEGKYADRIFFPLPGLVLLDLSLPDISGLEVLRRLRLKDRTQNIAVVILTASRSDQDYKEGMKLGVTAYINKPVDFIEFSTVMPRIGFLWQLMEHN